jgi:hypothetical protein
MHPSPPDPLDAHGPPPVVAACAVEEQIRGGSAAPEMLIASRIRVRNCRHVRSPRRTHRGSASPAARRPDALDRVERCPSRPSPRAARLAPRSDARPWSLRGPPRCRRPSLDRRRATGPSVAPSAHCLHLRIGKSGACAQVGDRSGSGAPALRLLGAAGAPRSLAPRRRAAAGHRAQRGALARTECHTFSTLTIPRLLKFS